jgi:hypothetical protein
VHAAGDGEVGAEHLHSHQATEITSGIESGAIRSSTSKYSK